MNHMEWMQNLLAIGALAAYLAASFKLKKYLMALAVR